jgi:peptide/nickel transport system permease protein
LIGGSGLITMLALVTAGPAVAPYAPHDVDTEASLAPPSRKHPMGTDQFGRDVLSRMLYGGRLTICAGLIAVGLSAVPGTAMGLLTGLIGYAGDLVIMRLVEMLMAFPSILLALVVMAIQGPGLENAMVAVGVSLVPTYVRVVRGTTLAIKETVYVEAARAVGCQLGRIAMRHVFPNVLPSVLVLSTVAAGWAILIGSSLSFLGLGPQPPTPEWGVDLANGRTYLRAAWWISTFPGFAIMAIVLSLNLLGDGLRDRLDRRRSTA